MDKQEVLKQCTIEGNVVKLPAGQLERNLYQEVAKSLELIGGKWKGKPVFGFVFPFDPTDLLNQIANGEKRNLKKEYQFFATPDKLTDELVLKADIPNNWTLLKMNPETRILEPSAGQGAIIKAIHRKNGEIPVHAVELMDINRGFLKNIPNIMLSVEKDFLKLNPPYLFDRIIANPPFSKNQDIDHIRKMYEVCKPGGRIVTIASKHWQISSNQKETEFKNWLDEIGAEVTDIDAGEFKESGTSIATCMIIIEK